jgi:V/A-type H+-transporting ATPase subunit E
MEPKIAQLTEALYREGVERGEAEAAKIIAEAQGRAQKLMADAQQRAESIIAAAQTRAQEIKKNTAAELKLAGQQALSAIKGLIVDAVTTRLIDTPTAAALNEPAVIRECILQMVSNWTDTSAPAEVILPQNRRAELEQALQGGLQELLRNGLSLNFSRNIKSGFQIRPQGSAFKISLSDEDFSAFFKDFLRPKTRATLFGE